LKLFKHGCESTTIHQLHEDPKTILEVERFVALHDGFTGAYLHNADFIFNCSALGSILWLCEFEGKKLSISDSHATENSGEAASTLLAHHLVELRWILLLNIGGMSDLIGDITTVFKLLLG